ERRGFPDDGLAEEVEAARAAALVIDELDEPGGEVFLPAAGRAADEEGVCQPAALVSRRYHLVCPVRRVCHARAMVRGAGDGATRKRRDVPRNARWTRDGRSFTVPAMDSTHSFAPRGGKAEVEEGTGFAPKFDSDGLIPAMAMDA